MQHDMFLVTPMTQTLYLEPGQVYTGKIFIANPADSTSDFKYTASVSPYGVTDEAYTADLATHSNHNMISDWITLDNTSGTLSPNDTSTIDYTITVPADAPGGAQYAAILVSQEKGNTYNTGMNIENIVEIASIIYANVSGETIYEGNILENNIPPSSLLHRSLSVLD